MNKKNNQRISILVYIIVIVLLIIFLGISYKNYFKSGKNNTQINSTLTDILKTYSLNEKIKTGSLELIAYSFEDYNNDLLINSLSKSGMWGWQNDYKLVSVDIEVKNIGNTQIDDILSFSIKDKDNREYRNIYIASGQREPMLDLMKKLQPQDTTRGYLTFAIPKDKGPYMLTLEDNQNVKIMLN